MLEEFLHKDYELVLYELIIKEMADKDSVYMSPSALKGYFLGLAVLPVEFNPEYWIFPIFGGKLPVFGSEHEKTLFFKMFEYGLNQYVIDFEEEQLAFPFNYTFDNVSVRYFNSVREWCYGFNVAVLLLPGYWYLDKDFNYDKVFNIIEEFLDKAPNEIKNIPERMDVDLALGLLRVIENYDFALDGLKELTGSNDEKVIKEYLLRYFYVAFYILVSYAYKKTEEIQNQYEHVGRNDPCPCGSGLKFKKCCGKNE